MCQVRKDKQSDKDSGTGTLSSRKNPMGDSHLNFIQNKLDQQLAIKITPEEEKYIYLIRKLREHNELVKFIL